MRKILIIAPLCAVWALPACAAGGAGGGHGGAHAGASQSGAHASGAHAGSATGSPAKPGGKPKGASLNVISALHGIPHGPHTAATPVPQKNP